MIAPDSINEVLASKHAQAEVNYIGVIIGPDLVVRNGQVVTVPKARDRHDTTLRSYGVRLKADPTRAAAEGGPDHQEHVPHAGDAGHEGVLRLLQ
ncbi:hypothetical protein [Variovorax paradoxus]|uniref:hypothetical protein n=1 Tax=Variovorax paradoxus TaxID=34073 RepID=UPI0030CDBBF9